MKTINLKEYKELVHSQDRKWEDVTYKCPRCNTLQSANDLVKAGCKNLEEAKKFIGFSCIGRLDKNKGCNYTLGGFLKLHELEIIDPDGIKHPLFMPDKGEE